MRTVHGYKKMNGYVKITGGLPGSKWQKRTAESTEEYKRGIRSPRRPWGKCACEAAERYKGAVDNAYAKDRFRRGVKRAGQRKWQSKTLRTGPMRWNQGVYDGGRAYAEGYKPYHRAFPSIFLPKRFRRGDPRNISRCSSICSALGQIKVRRDGTGKITCPED